MNEHIPELKKLAAEHLDQTLTRRRHLHQNPELSFQEFKTSAYIFRELEDMGLQPRRLKGDDGKGTGIIADIVGEGAGTSSSSLALRADMDALPIREENDIDFKSKNDGVMHACGHDAHSSIVLGCGQILQKMKRRFSGTVRLIFQPGEERTPGGAKSMIAQGALSGMDRIFGEHINPALPAGTVGFRPGLMMASADDIYLKVRGRGGHAASPHLGVDPVVIASNIILALQSVVSRKTNPELPCVLSFGKVIAAGATNVIPDEVIIEGTMRTVDEAWRESALEHIEAMARGTAQAMGGSCQVDIHRGYPVVENDTALTNRARRSAEAYVGRERVVDLPLVMWAEDFAYYNREIPGCFYNIGVGNEAKGWNSPLHSSTLMIDERALETGIGLMAHLALCELNTVE